MLASDDGIPTVVACKLSLKKMRTKVHAAESLDRQNILLMLHRSAIDTPMEAGQLQNG